MTEINLSHEISVTLVQHMGGDDSITRAAKVSTIGEASVDAEASAGLINFLMSKRHGTPFEHNGMTFLVRAPIAVFREWHRHRVGWSYNEESARYREMRPDFYVPRPSRPLVQVGKPGAYEFVAGSDEMYGLTYSAMKRSFESAYELYAEMLGEGVAKEVARGVLPVYIYSSMYATCNARSLMHFLSLRRKVEGSMFPSFPMWEIDYAAQEMEELFADLFPITYEAYVKNGRVAP